MLLKNKFCLNILILSISLSHFQKGNADVLPTYENNEDAQQDEGYILRENIKNDDTISRKGGRRRMFAGGCRNRPDKPVNGKLHCTLDSGCIASCATDYKFPNGLQQLAITCHDGEWQIQDTEWSFTPHCEPICMPECQNNGICIAPYECNCAKHFTGPQCQYENKPCLNFPPAILNSQRQCSQKTCTVACIKNFVFPDGSSVANLECKNGSWEPTKSNWVSIPDCQPVCDPPCQNGGNCLPLNVCQCPQDYRGPQCQYSSEVCNSIKLGFNGGYQCTSIGDTYSCSLNCPIGIEFDFPPAKAYTCTYDKGVFEPQPIPLCVYGSNVNTISNGTAYTSHTQMTNHTWSYSSVSEINNELSYGVKNNSTELYSSHNETFHQTNTGDSMEFGKIREKTFLIEVTKPEPKTCFVWGKSHYKTFDDKVFSFDSVCSYILVQEADNRAFTITHQQSPGCKGEGDCYQMINLFIQGEEYMLKQDSNYNIELRNSKKILPIPIQLSGLRAEFSAHFIVIWLDSIGVTIKWDGVLFLQIEAKENLWNNTVGLCGTMNGDSSDDLMDKNGGYPKNMVTLASSWHAEKIGEQCNQDPDVDHPCTWQPEVAQDAVEFCTKILSNRKFQACSKSIDLLELEAACRWEYCRCGNVDNRKCACDTMNVYVRQCAYKGIVSLANWRDDTTCPMKCTNGRIYMACGSKVQRTCWANIEAADDAVEKATCEEGCFCPEGSVLHGNKCILQDECPCRLRGKSFPPGTSVPKDCNTCTCLSGKWICTETLCSSRCSAIGDPHYTTFDGKHYDFMGKCKYYLMKANNYSIQVENVPCSGAISESMGFAPSTSEAPSCTKTVTIKTENSLIKLKQNRRITINGEDVIKLPMADNGVKIRAASSIFLAVKMPNDLEVWWDGISRVYINAPPEFYGKTQGLCGTFSLNQKDDFLTPDGDVEQNAVSFANKWKASEECQDIPRKEYIHPCDSNPQKRVAAESFCSKIYSDIFSDCHWYVDPEPWHKDCIFDMCSCEADIKSCLCPMLSAYAKECAAAGIKILWRPQIDECNLHCTNGQTYQICGNSCTRSCADISFDQDCREECVEGCNCPEGQTLDLNGECIPIGRCPCIYAGLEFQAGHKEVRPGSKGQELCTCNGGLWNCRLATADEIRDYPALADVKSQCLSSKNQQVTDCVPIEHKTCENMHTYEDSIKKSITECRSGCICKAGYVLENGECIKEEDCPCHHGGRSYKEGSVMQEECNTCKCTGAKWKCTDRICPGVCSAWGDSHYKTFDSKLYDFQGACNYILAKGSLSTEECFDVSIQNIPCSTTGATCSKSIVLSVGNGPKQESIALIRDKDLPKDKFQRIAVRSAGIFVFLDVPDLGLVLQWDKGTRVYIKLDPKWKGRVKGLCGDYNDNSEDDFKTPSGGISEASANLFGDSWKKDVYCPEPKDIADPCEQNPERKLWASQKCGLLKSNLFQSCHSEVEVEPFIKNCIFDTCACDSGGDCECLCTALAAYAFECAMRGIVIKWRTQELCPIQCDEKCSNYSPCLSTCPYETCENLMTLRDKMHLCSQDTCVEGCSYKPCPENHVFWNSSFVDCVPKSDCNPFCTEINGTSYYEGDQVSTDDCHTCFCTRGKVVCKGEPCLKTTLPVSTVPLEQPLKCTDGWTAWLNRDVAIKGKKLSDVEPLPTLFELSNIKGSAICDVNQMVDIKCRSVKEHKAPKETGLDVECSLERGLYCQSERKGAGCLDFEISVLCQCKEPTTVTPIENTTEDISRYDNCDVTQPNKEHPSNCHLFYQCVPGLMGTNEFVEKTCGPNMFYNPRISVCDWPYNVLIFKPECGVEQTTFEVLNNITTIDVEVVTTISKNKTVTTKEHNNFFKYISDICKEGQTWSDCAIECERSCQYYQHLLTGQGYCNEETSCIPGCVPIDRPNCPSYKFWRDADTCVNIADCICKSHDGEPVKPGTVVRVSDCEICQCVNNYFACDKSLCATTIEPELTTVSFFSTIGTNAWVDTVKPLEEHTIIIGSTVTPPELCDSKEYIPLIEHYLPDRVTFNASSYKLPTKSIKIHPFSPSLMGDSWEPEFNSANQWLEIKLNKPVAIYGIILQGSSYGDKFVTSYKILFSEDGYSFSYIMDHEQKPRVFHGPLDSKKTFQQQFYEPVEAKIIRIVPLSWHNGISIKAEILGCKDYVDSENISKITTLTTSTPTYIEETVIPVCEDLMGLDNGLIADDQISASSTLTVLLPNIRLSSSGIWQPQLDTPDQFVQFDLLELRNLTGIITKGSGNIWTTTYKVFYSNDGYKWNSVLDNYSKEKVFLANFDSATVKKNFFERPLHARYLKIQPISWHEHIGLKVEIIGCFLPYPEKIPDKIEIWKATTEINNQCNVCKGVTEEYQQNCKCEESYWWDGDSCVTKQECPCVVGHMIYPVGSIYETEDCLECVCTLGGAAACLPKKCDPCKGPDVQSVITELCTCICKPCPIGTRHCPTSDICINETLWCNNVNDCPDDERDCPSVYPTTSTTHATTESTEEIKITHSPPTIPPVPCEKPTCPPGYKTIIKIYNKRKTTGSSVNIYTKGGKHSGVKGYRKTSNYRDYLHHGQGKTVKSHIPPNELVCPQYSCTPNKPPPSLNQQKPTFCPEAKCPRDYTIVYEKMSMHKLQKCPKYVCKPPQPKEAICNVTGRTFNTFDHLEYKYDICNHILARDMYGNKWYITLEKQCKIFNESCKKILVITIDDHVVVLHPDMHIDIDKYTFTGHQVARLGDKPGFFKISHVGNTMYFVSNNYGFWVMWDSSSNVKIGISTKLAGYVDGLCGYFDGNLRNDKRLPDGTQSQSTASFGDSWIMEGSPECDLQTHVCPRETQDKAWVICSSVKDLSLSDCAPVINMERFASHCLETSCACLSSNSTYEECRCRALTTFVTDCQASDHNIDLSTWRNNLNCPVTCPAPFIHKDCFRNKCEMTCENQQELDPCPLMHGVCFSGCFCPDGTVRNGEDCIIPTKCQDCSCEGLGNSKFVTFDGQSFGFDGNCTYILSRNTVQNVKGANAKHLYEVYVTNVACNKEICTQALTVVFKEHIVQLRQYDHPKKFYAMIDGSEFNHCSLKNSWLELKENTGGDVTLSIPEVDLELSSFLHNFAFVLKLPSHAFGDAIEGLCGNCNGDREDDLKKPDGEITDEEQQFGESWLASDAPSTLAFNMQHCHGEAKNKCTLPPADQNPCLVLLDPLQFGQCHNVFDPEPYLTCCQDNICSGGSYCDSIEAYARKCLSAGFCHSWRSSKLCPYKCPEHLEYQPCGTSCTATCDNIDEMNHAKCLQNIAEGCYCPQNYVLQNQTCIPKEKCFPCDEDGHFDGDVWSKDKCTTCSCDKTAITCHKTDCPAIETVCEESLSPVLISGTEQECCPKYFCAPKPTPVPICLDVQKPECGYGQITKLTVVDGCQRFVCECLPPNECPGLNEVALEVDEVLLDTGFVQVINNTGCCPRPVRICRPDICPQPKCPDYYIANITHAPNSCCPDYKCEPPRDICLYKTLMNSDLEYSEFVMPKKIGEEWREEKCKKCSCDEDNEFGVKINCITTDCISMDKHPDFNDFLLREIIVENECCPSFERISCKFGDSIYNVGDLWYPDQENVCIAIECVKDTSGIQKIIKEQTCPESCDFGYEYKPSENTSLNCCGNCVPLGCIVGDEIKEIGHTWYSDDHCTQYTCALSTNSSFYIQEVIEKCIDVELSETNEYKIEKRKIENKCCPEIVKTGCIYDGIIYEPGQEWRLSHNNCIIETCKEISNGLIKEQKIETCSRECQQGWEYQESDDNKCCGECKQTYCIIDGISYKPGKKWFPNKCITNTCVEQDNQLMIHSSLTVCPDVTNCPPQAIYYDECCKQCNLTALEPKATCSVSYVDSQTTIGLLVEKHVIHGVCKNIHLVEGIAECKGICNSSTHFDTAYWGQWSDCHCCQPKEFKGLIVELMCEDGKMIKKQLAVPTSCSCEECASANLQITSKKTSTKG
ncbi:hemocytin-like [Prorops nasuta]|uniref:hemocytin-like n=1 Tax=Prorops nasuta TaxID=863751 RepID=UPI0034D01234